ncbi:MAG: sigma-70 family RNA polymerase sigma factor [Patescibacteria group bacterium]
MKDEEEKIVKKAKKGDDKAFGELYDTYMPRIYRFIFLKVKRKQDAEDLSHQVFLSAWQNIQSYEFRGFPFSSWLYRIAGNAVIDYYRTWKNNASLDNMPEDYFSENPELAKNVDAVMDIQFVKTFLHKLESDQQNVLIMKFVDDLSNKEIAEALGKKEGAVRVIQHRALKQLKKYIDESRPYSKTEEA